MGLTTHCARNRLSVLPVIVECHRRSATPGTEASVCSSPSSCPRQHLCASCGSTHHRAQDCRDTPPNSRFSRRSTRTSRPHPSAPDGLGGRPQYASAAITHPPGASRYSFASPSPVVMSRFAHFQIGPWLWLILRLLSLFSFRNNYLHWKKNLHTIQRNKCGPFLRNRTSVTKSIFWDNY